MSLPVQPILRWDSTSSVAVPRQFRNSLQSQLQESQIDCDHIHHNPPLVGDSTQDFPPMDTSIERALSIISHYAPAPIAEDAPVAPSIIGSVIAEDVYTTSAVPANGVCSMDDYATMTEQDNQIGHIWPGDSIASANLQSGVVASRCQSNARLEPESQDSPIVIHGKQHGRCATESLAIGNQADNHPTPSATLQSKIFTRGDVLSPISGAISVLAMEGIQTVKVFRKPRVGVLCVGRNQGAKEAERTHVAARLAVLSGLHSWGFPITDLGTIPNCSDGHALGALAGVDVLLIIQDSSTMDRKFNSTIECTFGGTIHFDCVSINHNGYTSFATIPTNTTEQPFPQYSSRPTFLLPGNPASALVTLNVFVLPLLNKLAGLREMPCTDNQKLSPEPQIGLPRVAVVLTHHIPLDPTQTECHLAIVTGSRSDARLYATGVRDTSFRARSQHGGEIVKANALLLLRAGRGVGIKGEIVDALLMGPIFGSDTRIIC